MTRSDTLTERQLDVDAIVIEAMREEYWKAHTRVKSPDDDDAGSFDRKLRAAIFTVLRYYGEEP